jgi:polysaccharide deacetylase 2 family uncharacterized protein YibQ
VIKVKKGVLSVLLIIAGVLALALILFFILRPSPNPLIGFDLEQVIGTGKITPSNTYTPSNPELEVPLISIVVDDNGYNLQQSRMAFSLPFPLTISVMPSLKYSRDVALEAKRHGKEVILHCPMESHKGNDWLGPGAILSSMSDEEVKKQVEADLYDVPGAIGMNNHMGTKVTEDRRVMGAILSYLKERGLFFLDSRVTPKSVARELGNQIGIPVLENDLSLDHDTNPKAIRENMRKLGEIAKRKGSAIGIIHIYTKDIISLLKEGVDLWNKEGIRIVPLSEILLKFWPSWKIPDESN